MIPRCRHSRFEESQAINARISRDPMIRGSRSDNTFLPASLLFSSLDMAFLRLFLALALVCVFRTWGLIAARASGSATSNRNVPFHGTSRPDATVVFGAACQIGVPVGLRSQRGATAQLAPRLNGRWRGVPLYRRFVRIARRWPFGEADVFQIHSLFLGLRTTNKERRLPWFLYAPALGVSSSGSSAR